MPEYRRPQIPGGTFFITIVTYKRFPILTDPRARAILNDVWHVVTERFPFTTDAICLLPDHIHALITLPEEETNFSIRIREIKRLFTKAYLTEIGSMRPRSQSRINKREATVWQRRFYEHTIRDERDLEIHVEYIHYNPVKHGLVDLVSEWEWSSFHRYVKDGLYSPDWGEGLAFKEDQRKFGELGVLH
jgi:putative transposase